MTKYTEEAKQALSRERLMEVLSYDESTGLFTWLVDKSVNGLANKGMVAGRKNNTGHVNISVDGIRYQAHQLAWLYVYGNFPDSIIDHKNGIRDDNRIKNLRVATFEINGQNRKFHNSNNKLNLLGVSFHKATGKFRATICINKKCKHIGTFETAELAHEAYLIEKRKHHAGCTI